MPDTGTETYPGTDLAGFMAWQVQQGATMTEALTAWRDEQCGGSLANGHYRLNHLMSAYTAEKTIADGLRTDGGHPMPDPQRPQGRRVRHQPERGPGVVNVPETAEEKVAEYLRASVVAAVAGVLRDAEGQPVEVTAEALVALFDRVAIIPLAGEVERLRGVADSAQEDASTARTDGYMDALRWVLADLEANRSCSAYAFIQDFRARLSAIENGAEKP